MKVLSQVRRSVFRYVGLIASVSLAQGRSLASNRDVGKEPTPNNGHVIWFTCKSSESSSEIKSACRSA